MTVLSVPGSGKWWSTSLSGTCVNNVKIWFVSDSAVCARPCKVVVSLSGTCVNNVKIWFVSDSAVCARPWQVVVHQSVSNLCE